jgi:YVTN family beta-propeller protein
MRYFKCFPIILLAVTLSYSNDPEQSIAPPGMIYELLALNKDLPTTARPKYLSPNVIVASLDAKQFYVAEQTAKQVAVVDIATKTVVTTVKLPNEPTGIAVAPSGLLYVTCSSDIWPDGMVCEVNPVLGKVLRRLPAGHGACSPVISPVELTLFVCNVYDNDVSVIDIGGAKEIKRIKAVREPRCAAITPDGATLVVGNALPDQAATDTASFASKITLISTLSREKIIDLPLPIGSKSIAGIAMSMDGKYAFATHLSSDFSIPLTKIDFGAQSNHIAIVDIKQRKILNDAMLDVYFAASANPWGIACTQDGKILCIAHSGSNELSIIDMRQLMTIADTSVYISTPETLRNNRYPLGRNRSALSNIIHKIPVEGKSPRCLTIIGSQAFTAGYFSDKLEIFNLGLDNATIVSGSVTLGPAEPLTSARKGESALYDASLCYQKWQSCHSCHPFARSDATNWTLRNEFAAPKNTKSLMYSWWTPPAYWLGPPANAYEAIRGAMVNELFLDPDMAVAGSIDTLFGNLKPVPSPHLVKGKFSAAASRGKALFFHHPSLDCKKCHPAPLYTGLKSHNSGTVDPYDNNENWDTPSIIECWRTAPYNHLGSEKSVKDRISVTTHTNASKVLTEDEHNDLVEFVLSL